MWWSKKKPVKKIKSSEIRILILAQCKAVKVNGLHLLDREYILPSEAQVGDVVFHSKVDHKKYVKEIYDCDNFAVDLLSAFSGKGFCFGLAFIKSPSLGYHAVSFYVDDQKKLQWIEPQTDRKLTDDGYEVIMMLIP